MFTQIQYDIDVFYQILRNKLEIDEIVDEFLLHFNSDIMFISGSTLLQTITGIMYDNSDIDIYVNISTEEDIIHLENLVNFLKELKFKSDAANVIRKTCKKILDGTFYDNEILYDHTNLINYTFKMKKENKTFDIIIMQSDIEVLIENSFDFDIIKNYYHKNKIYSYNKQIENIATIDTNYFLNNICVNENNFHHFLKRYIKYNNRGYQIYVGKTKLSNNIINLILKITTSYPIILSNENDIHAFEYRDVTIVNNRFVINTIIIDLKQHIAKILLFTYLQQKNKFIKNLNMYSNLEMETYLHPESKFINQLAINMTNIMNSGEIKNKKNKIYYLTSDNNLKSFICK